jgi:hypothetical protein
LFFNAGAPIWRDGQPIPIRGMTMSDLSGNSGFAPPRAEETLSRRRAHALELIATAALTVSLIVAVTAVSIGDRTLARGYLAGQAPVQVLLPR